MAYVFSLIEAGTRPAILTRTLRLEGKAELVLSLFLDLRPSEALPAGLRRTAVVEAEHLPIRDPFLVRVGVFRCRLELGSLRVDFVPLRPPAPSDSDDATASRSGSEAQRLSAYSLEADAFWSDSGAFFAHDGNTPSASDPSPAMRSGPTSRTGSSAPLADPSPLEGGHSAASLGIRVVALPAEGGIRPLDAEESLEPGARFRLLPAPEALALSLPRAVTFEVSWHDEEAQTLGRVRSGAHRLLTRGTPEPPSNWLVPHADRYLGEPLSDLYDWIYERLEKAGLSPGGIALAFSVIMGTSGLIFLAVQLDELAEAAESERDAALAAATKFKQGTVASVEREEQCRAELAETTRSLGNVDSADRLDAERSLGHTLAEVAWRRIKGDHDPGLDGPEARRARTNRLLDQLRERKTLREKEELPLASYRLRLPLASSLGPDLPRHVLLWHSHPRLAGQPRFTLKTAGADFRGLWGLSSRVVQSASPSDYRASTLVGLTDPGDASELRDDAQSVPDESKKAESGDDGSRLSLEPTDPKRPALLTTDTRRDSAASRRSGAPAPQAARLNEPQDDVRDEAEWCANQLGEGIRTIREALLTADSGGLLPVYPEQLHLWSLALWHAYNHMPDLTFGRGPGLEGCVSALTTDLAILRQEGGERSTPILPDALDTLTSNAWTGGVLATTALCPWREDRLVEGLRIAFDTIIDDWILREQEAHERQGSGP